jgi:ABC-2 type transport system ATP-binding protein
MLEVDAATKRFGTRTAADRISFEVRRGELYGLLGHNGAGKSTTIGMILGQIHPDAGTVRVGGWDVFTHRARALAPVGAIFETPCFYEYLSGWKNLEIFTAYSRLTRAEEIRRAVARVGLGERIHDNVGKYSHGMRQRLALAQALLPDPEFLILDEPTDGLDPEGIAEMRELVLDLNRREGLTILLCSHQLEEVQRMCRRLAILREGKLVFAGDWRELGTMESALHVETDRTLESIGLLESEGLVRIQGRELLLTPGSGVGRCAERLVAAGHVIRCIGPKERTLEDFYLSRIHDSGGRS